jgi:hypothetical protein
MKLPVVSICSIWVEDGEVMCIVGPRLYKASKADGLLPPRQAAKLPRCGCSLEWFCDPHNICFIHKSCFCEGSGAFPPVKPICSYWCRFSQDFLAELLSQRCSSS